MSRECLGDLRDACDTALGVLGEASETIGKGRGKGHGLARMLREAAYRLGEASAKCIQGCGVSSLEPRCVVGDIVDRLQAVMQGVALRLDRVGRIETSAEEELARIVIDTLYSVIDSICRYAAQLD